MARVKMTPKRLAALRKVCRLHTAAERAQARADKLRVERDEEVRRLRGEDYTLASIGAVLELSRERIRQMAEDVA